MYTYIYMYTYLYIYICVCVAMFLTRKHDENIVKCNLHFQTEKIQDVTNHKHIGLIHSSDATWKTHL